MNPRSASACRAGLAWLLGLGWVLAAGTQAAWAQEATISGRVTDERGEPLAGATVSLLGTALSAATNTRGQYTFRIDADRVGTPVITLQARYIGRRTVSFSVPLTPGTLTRDFQLVPDPFKLDEIVVSGVLRETEHRKLTLSVSSVSGAQLREVPSQDPFTALIGKAPGVVVSASAGGAPGSAGFIRMRSATSMTPTSQTQQPLIIVDGLLTREGIADLNVQDIERVELVKGPAGASLYGSDAAAGVLQIFTRRGRQAPEGKTLITLRGEFGRSSPMGFLERNRSHFCANFAPASDFARNADGTVDCEVKPDHYLDLPYPALAPWRNQQEYFFGSQNIVTSHLALTRRQGGGSLYGSWERTGNNGVIAVPGLDATGLVRHNLRLNLDQVVSERLEVSLGGFYATSENHIPDPFGVWGGLRRTPPDVDLLAPNLDGQPYRVDAAKYSAMTPQVGFRNPLYLLSIWDATSDRSRFQGNAGVRWRPVSWLVAEGAYAYDRLSEQYREVTPRGALLPGPGGVGTYEGDITVANLSHESHNASGTLRGTHRTGALTGTASLSLLLESSDRGTVTATGAGFTTSGAPTLENTDPTRQRTYERRETVRSRNYAAGLALEYKDRYLVDALVRSDATSLFGPDARRRTFYRASGAWRVNQDVPIRGVDEMRLRASIGTAGLRPPFESQYETFSVLAGLVQPDILGNRNLRPAYSTEWDVGFNLELLSRFSLEYTHARKTTRDQVLLAPLPSTSGFRAQWQNAGTLAGRSHEVSLQAVLVNTRAWNWRLGATFDRSTTTITELAVPAFSDGPVRYEAGVPFGSYDATRFVRSCAELLQNPENAAADCGGYEVNSDGYLIQKGTQGTPAERPIRFVDEMGRQTFPVDPAPDFVLGFQTMLAWKGFSLYGLLDWRRGGRIQDQARAADILSGSFTGAFYDQRGKPEALKKSYDYYDAFNAISPGPSDWTLRDGSYARLRELSLSWTLGPRELQRIGARRWLSGARLALVGRNLFTFTRFAGWDPEANVIGAQAAYGAARWGGLPPAGDPTGSRLSVPTYPGFRTISAVVEVSF